MAISKKKKTITKCSLPTEQTDGKMKLSEIRMLIMGPPKAGKSTLCSGFPNALFLATEKGYGALKIYVKDIMTWQDFKDIVKDIVKGKHEFKTIVIDTADILFKLCADDGCDKLGIDHMSDGDFGKGYSIVTDEFDRELNKLFMTNYGIILISHIKVQELIGRYGKSMKIVPTLSNQARRVIMPKVDIIGYLNSKLIKIDDKKYKQKRIINFEPSEELECGDRTGMLPSEIVCYKDPKKTYDEFYKYFNDKKGGE